MRNMPTESSLQELNRKLSAVATRIQRQEDEIQKFTDEMRPPFLMLEPDLDKVLRLQNFAGSSMILQFQTCNPDGLTVAAVDGGMSCRQFMGFDLLFLRPAGVVFRYGKDSVAAERFGDPVNDLEITLVAAESEIRSSAICSVRRYICERRMALRVAAESNPDFLLLDGAISLPPIDVKSCVPEALWLELECLQGDLCDVVTDAGIRMAGIIKDSRSKQFVHSLLTMMPALCKRSDMQFLFGGAYRDLLRGINDMSLLRMLIKWGEATAPQRVIEKDKPETRLWRTYLKTAILDAPICVEFLASNSVENDLMKLATTILSISGKTDFFSLPLPILEADALARLTDSEIDPIASEIVSQALGVSHPTMLKRSRTPF